VGADNLCIWRTANGSLAKSYIQKGHEGWQPQWTCDDGKLLQRTNNQISIFEASDLSTWGSRQPPFSSVLALALLRSPFADFRLSPLRFLSSQTGKRVQAVPVENIADFAVSPAKGLLTFAAFIKGKKVGSASPRAPSFWKENLQPGIRLLTPLTPP
jgi:uncharacterized protein with WD repeat